MLGSNACAVLLHELVAHALETDTLALGGRAEAALGAKLGGDLLNVIDDPSGAPEGVQRTTDDEGTMVVRKVVVEKWRGRTTPCRSVRCPRVDRIGCRCWPTKQSSRTTGAEVDASRAAVAERGR